MRGPLEFLIGLLPVVIVLVVIVVVFYEPPPSCGKAVVCAQITYTCEGKKRVSMEINIINDTEVAQAPTFYEKTTAESGKFGEETTPIHLEPGKVESSQRSVQAGITDEVIIKLGDAPLAEGKLVPGDLCKWNDTRK
jgi:hypothetical protein